MAEDGETMAKERGAVKWLSAERWLRVHYP
jgi:hypothetical protein